MNWLTLVYKISREPSKGRVYVWRKLKQLGAISVQGAIWILPATPRTQEQLQWLAAEIVELNGEATLLRSQFIYAADGASLRKQFEEPVIAAYKKILRAMTRRNPDLAALSKQYQQTKERDFFCCPLGEQVRQRLLEEKGGKG